MLSQTHIDIDIDIGIHVRVPQQLLAEHEEQGNHQAGNGLVEEWGQIRSRSLPEHGIGQVCVMIWIGGRCCRGDRSIGISRSLRG